MIDHTLQLIERLRQQDMQLQTQAEFGGSQSAVLLGYDQMSLDEVDRCVSLLRQVWMNEVTAQSK